MKQFLRSFLPLFAFCWLGTLGTVQAQSTGHYSGGLEGIKAASLPPPGVYLRLYNYFYGAGRLNDSNGDRLTLVDPDLFVYAGVPRIIWITDAKILGGYLGVDALVPLIQQSADVISPIGRFDDRNFGVGDAFAEATLSWHVPHFDFSIGAGLWMPTGYSSPPPTTDAGLGFWTTMLTAGATWFIDDEKTWSLSALGRYEFNSEQRDTDITPGQALTLEWGAAKTLFQVVDVGVVGYFQRQTTSGNVNGSRELGNAAAIGPEMAFAIPKAMMSISVRYLHEFSANDRAQGDVFTLTLTKRF